MALVIRGKLVVEPSVLYGFSAYFVPCLKRTTKTPGMYNLPHYSTFTVSTLIFHFGKLHKACSGLKHALQSEY